MNNLRLKALCKIIALAIAVIISVCIFAACGAKDASSTNNQTAGVDESDIVKVTSDGFIFKAQSDGLSVSKANDGSVEVMVKEPYSDYTPIEMLVSEDLLMIFGDKKVQIEDTNVKMTKTEVKIFDLNLLKSGTNGYLVKTTEFFGTFLMARHYGEQAFVVTKLNYANFYGDTDVNFYYDSISGIKSFKKEDSLGNSLNSSQYYGFIVAKFDLTTAKPAVDATFFSGDNISDVYFSPFGIYAISSETSQIAGCGYNPRAVKTIVSLISLSSISMLRQVEVDGSILNRHCLYDNGLVLYVLVSNFRGGHKIVAYDNSFKLISGNSKEFAFYETLYSVLFKEDICFVVTFREVDPLFKIDISNPTNIVILDELKIDGYSTHLQSFLGDTTIGLGFEANPWRQENGIKITLFDTKNDLAELNSILFSEEYGSKSYSPATDDPKAILSEPQNNIFAFPVFYIKDQIEHQGAIVFAKQGNKLVEVAFLSNFEDGEDATDFYKTITRIVRIGDYLYTISDGYITSYNLSDFSFIDIFDTRIS